MKILNQYILKKYLSTFFLAIGLIILIAIIIDLSEKIDDFIYKKAPLHLIIIQYYLNFIPYFVNLFTPLFTFIAVIFFTSKMAGNTEIIAILSSGISFKKMLVPFLYGALIIAAMTFFFSNLLIPLNNKYRLDFEAKYLKKRHFSSFNNIHIQLEPKLHAYCEYFDVENNVAYGFTLERFDDNQEIIEKLGAKSIVFDTATNVWRCLDFFDRTIDKTHESLSLHIDTILQLPIHPADFNIQSEDPATKNVIELSRFIEREKQRGSPLVKSYLIDKYQRLLNPLTVIIMTFIGVAVSSRKVKGGIGIHLTIGITLAFGFIIFSKVSTVFSVQGNLPPFLSVAIPPLIFAILAYFLIKKTPK